MANKFETEIAKSFRTLIPGADFDLPVPYIYTKLVVNKTNAYGVKTPCDALVDSLYTCNLALELKESLHRSSFPFDRLPVHQEQGLMEFQNIGRQSYLLICFRSNPKIVGSKPAAWAIPIYLYLYLKEFNLNNKRVSLSADQIEKYGISIPVVKNAYGSSVWDITVL